MHEWLWRSWLREVGDSAYETSGLSTCMRPGAAAPSAPDLALPVSRSPDLEQHHEHVCAVDFICDQLLPKPSRGRLRELFASHCSQACTCSSPSNRRVGHPSGDFLAHIESPKSDGRPPEKQRRPPRTAQFTVDDL